MSPSSIRSGSTLAAAISARNPGRGERLISSSPRRTRKRFSPTSGTRSATVASATRSRSRIGASVRRRLAIEGLGELRGDGGPAERLERVAADAGMDDRAGGQLGSGLVVVGDDRRDPGGLDRRDLTGRGDSAVDRDDESGPALAQGLERGVAEPVAVPEAIGNQPVALGARRRSAATMIEVEQMPSTS